MFAKAPNVNLDRVFRNVLFVGKQPIGQLVLGKDLAGCVEKQFKKAQFAIAHCNGLTPDSQVACDRVENDATDLDLGSCIAGPATQDSADTGLQLGVIKGFGDIIISTQIKRTDSIRHLASGGQDDHRSVQITGAMLLKERAAIAIRQHDIEQDKIVFPGRNKGRGVFKFLCMINDMTIYSHA